MQYKTTKHIDIIESIEDSLALRFKDIDRIVLTNQEKVLQAFKDEGIGAHHFQTTTGYGYNDMGREALENLFARIFRTEAALVRQQFASGTHAITCCLRGVLRPGDEVVFASGMPYDTLQSVLGINENPPIGNLSEYKIKTHLVPLKSNNGLIDVEGVKKVISSKTKIISFQRSCGYSLNQSIQLNELERAFQEIKKCTSSSTVFFVDNCYGEFVNKYEPTDFGADLMAGSLIKNPGGGLAPSGGYVVGKAHLIEEVAAALFAPGIGREVGASLHNPRPFFQGLFEAPARVGEMIKASVLWAEIFRSQGLATFPEPYDERTDIIQRVEFLSPKRLNCFCRVIQGASPIDSKALPIAAEMPGYDHPVIMAAGTFISGSTSELSADAPFIPPYSAFLQGGLSLAQTRLAILHWLEEWEKEEENFGDGQESHSL